MGYEINSPVKQVWLPIDYLFIQDNFDNNFGDFAKAYKEKYGIDLHDIFELIDDGTYYTIKIKGCILSTYNVGLITDSLNLNIINVDGIIKYNRVDKEDYGAILISFGVQIPFVSPMCGQSITIQIPSEGIEVNSIDDLWVGYEEI